MFLIFFLIIDINEVLNHQKKVLRHYLQHLMSRIKFILLLIQIIYFRIFHVQLHLIFYLILILNYLIKLIINFNMIFVVVNVQDYLHILVKSIKLLMDIYIQEQVNQNYNGIIKQIKQQQQAILLFVQIHVH
jgi:hypothetical protein